MPDMQQKTIESLPNEVLVKIFARVQFSEDNWKSLRLTCRGFDCLMTTHKTSLIIDIGYLQYRAPALLRRASPKAASWLRSLCDSTFLVDRVLIWWEALETEITQAALSTLGQSRFSELFEIGLHLLQFFGSKPVEEYERILEATSEECCVLMGCAFMLVAFIIARVITENDPSMLFLNPSPGNQDASFPYDDIHLTTRLRLLWAGLDEFVNYILVYNASDDSPETLRERIRSNDWMRRDLFIAPFLSLERPFMVQSSINKRLLFERRLKRIMGANVDKAEQGLVCMCMMAGWKAGKTNLGEALGGMTV